MYSMHANGVSEPFLPVPLHVKHTSKRSGDRKTMDKRFTDLETTICHPAKSLRVALGCQYRPDFCHCVEKANEVRVRVRGKGVEKANEVAIATVLRKEGYVVHGQMQTS